MKRTLIMILLLIVIISNSIAIADTVIKQNVDIHFADVTRTGLYSGEVDADGIPNGFGVFEAENAYGNRYIIVGNWIDGINSGECWSVWDSGEINIGEYVNGDFVRGMASINAQMIEYSANDDIYASGYTTDSIFNADVKRLDNDSIIMLFSNIFGSEPVVSNGQYMWNAEGMSFCGFDMDNGTVIIENGEAKTIAYVLKDMQWDNADDLAKRIDDVFTLVSRISAKSGKKMAYAINGKVISDFDLDDKCNAILSYDAMLDGQVQFMAINTDGFALAADIRSDVALSGGKQTGYDKTISIKFLIVQ